MSEKNLQPWIDFLGEQIERLDAAFLAKTGAAHLATPEAIAFLKVDDEMEKGRVEAAIKEFGRGETWPQSLTRDQLVNLTHRANSARAICLAIHGGKLPVNTPQLLGAPRSTDRRNMITWLLIDLWGHAGRQYLDGVTNKYLEQAHG